MAPNSAATRGKVQKPGRKPGRRHSMPAPRPSASPDSTMKAEDIKLKKLHMSLDYGTKTLSVAYRLIADESQAAKPSHVHKVHFMNREYFAPQIAGWGKDGTFFWGHAVEEAISKGHLRHEDRIELWKLLLYKDHEYADLVKEVERQLGDRDLEELISTHLREVIEAAKHWIKQAQTWDYTTEQIEDLPLELFLSIPQMWKAPANLVMTKAAKAAGIERVELVYEPQCAAAFYTHSIQRRLPQQISLHDKILVADIGGGTGDFCSYEYCQDSDAGAEVKLRLSGEPVGALCGSEFINQNFLRWLEKKDFLKKCKALGLTRTSCMKQASATFETVKQKFNANDGESRFVPIRGSQGAKQMLWDVKITSDETAGFIDPLVSDIIRNIDKLADATTKVIIIPGGFGRSIYLLNKLKARYEPGIRVLGQAHATVGAYEPVSRGALLRYKSIETRGIPSRESFGIAAVETYDPILHPDATLFPGDDMPSGLRKFRGRTPKPNNEIVEIDPFNGERIVFERWCSLIRKGVLKLPGQSFTTETWQQAIIPVGAGDDQISLQVYWTESNIQEHEPIRMGKDGRSQLRKGIEPWGDELVIKLPVLEELGFEVRESEKRGEVYEIFYRILLQFEGANVRLLWQLALPGTEPYDEQGERRTSKIELTPAEVYELCAASHNPFPRISVQ